MRKACCNACPSQWWTEECTQAQNWGCLPEIYEIKEYLKEGKVWMCHSNNNIPCVATGLDVVPDGFVKMTEEGIVD